MSLPGTKRCKCCGAAACSCNTCNYVAVLIFCGSRGVADQYEIYFQGELITTITDNATAEGCRVFVIGNLDDVCDTTVADLKTTYGVSAVTLVQLTDLDDARTCDDTIDSYPNCRHVTLEVLPLGGVSVHDLSYSIYTTCHEGPHYRFEEDGTIRTLEDGTPRLLESDTGETARKNCCPLTTGGPLSGSPDTGVLIEWDDACCCCCPVFIDCEGPGSGGVYTGNINSTFDFTNAKAEVISVTGGVETVLCGTVLEDMIGPFFDNPDNPSCGYTNIFTCGSSPQCLKGLCLVLGIEDCESVAGLHMASQLTVGFGGGAGCDVQPECKPCCLGWSIAAEDPHFRVECRNGVLVMLCGEDTGGSGAIIFNPDDRGATEILPDESICNIAGGYATVHYSNVAFQKLYADKAALIALGCPDPPDFLYYRFTTDIRYRCGTPPAPIMGAMPAAAKAAAARTPAKAVNRPPARGKCAFLGDRTEFKKGCFSGRMCAHECDHPDDTKRALHMVAVPGGNCQTCQDFDAIG